MTYFVGEQRLQQARQHMRPKAIVLHILDISLHRKALNEPALYLPSSRGTGANNMA